MSICANEHTSPTPVTSTVKLWKKSMMSPALWRRTQHRINGVTIGLRTSSIKYVYKIHNEQTIQVIAFQLNITRDWHNYYYFYFTRICLKSLKRLMLITRHVCQSSCLAHDWAFRIALRSMSKFVHRCIAETCTRSNVKKNSWSREFPLEWLTVGNQTPPH